jgi:hypothetical protein
VRAEFMSQSASPYVSREDWVCHIFNTRRPLLAHLVGLPSGVEVEVAATADRVDHVWFTVQVPPCGSVLVSVNTLSRLNRAAGFDHRMRLGILRTVWEEVPEPFLEECEGLDYRKIESEHPIDYHPYEHDPLAELLVAKGRAAVRVEAWGELYRRKGLGMHQIHSRRASGAVRQDIVGKDGALRFYLPDKTAEMFLFKYVGQR